VAVLAGVEEDVGEGVADLARRAEGAGVVTAVEDGAGAMPEAVESAGDAREEAGQAAFEVGASVGFDDPVGVVAQDDVVGRAEAGLLAAVAERLLEP
jgi:hypothetical protein